MVFHYLLYALNFVNSNCPLLRFDGKVALLSVWQLFSADLSATYKHWFWQELREIRELNRKKVISKKISLQGELWSIVLCKMEDDETSQNEEIEALVSIYDNSLTLLPSSSGKAFEIKIDVNEATLRLNFPPDYPSISSVWF